MAQGWVYYNWSMENDGWILFCNVRRDSPGYVKQEIDRMMKMLGLSNK